MITTESITGLLDSLGVSDNIEKVWVPRFIKYFPKYGLDTPSRILGFLGQTAHESGNFYYTEEIDKHRCQRYEGGCKFLGRGLIGTTHESNYRALSKFLGKDFVSHPELVGGPTATTSTNEQLDNSLLAALFFWTHHNLNEFADKIDLNQPVTSANNLKAYRQLGNAINRGNAYSTSLPNNDQDRINRFEKLRVYYAAHKPVFTAASKKSYLLPVAVMSGVLFLGGIVLVVWHLRTNAKISAKRG